MPSVNVNDATLIALVSEPAASTAVPSPSVLLLNRRRFDNVPADIDAVPSVSVKPVRTPALDTEWAMTDADVDNVP